MNHPVYIFRFRMSTCEDVQYDRSASPSISSENSDKICSYCNRKVGEFLKCIKCDDIFHPSCLVKAANRKNTTCHHASAEEISAKSENKSLRTEVEYLKLLLEETKSKNSILIENNNLLKDKITILENQIKSGKNTTKKFVNTLQDKVPAVVTDTVASATTFKNTYSSVVHENRSNAHEHRPQAQMSFVEPKRIVNNVNNSVPAIPEININDSNKNISTSVHKIKDTDRMEDWITVRNKKRQSRNTKVCFGTKENSADNSTIKGAIRRRWMYVGKIAGKEISEKDILTFLKDIEGKENIIIKKLNTLGQNSSFSIGLPNENAYKSVFCESFWPQGVVLRDFSFDRNFFRKNRQNEKT